MKKILLVDDYRDWLDVEKEFIELNNDAECITFDNPVEVLIYLRQGNTADIIITDYQMPQMDGFSLAKFIDIEFPDIEIVISSGSDIKELETIRRECGLEDKVEIISKGNLEYLKNII